MNNPLQGIRDYFRPTNEVRKRDIFREFVSQGGFRPGVEATAKAIPRDMARFAISAAEAPNALRTGKANGKFYNTPFGRINSFQNEAQNRVQRGDQMWKAMGNPMMDTILGGSDLGAVAGIGARAMRGVSPLARDFTNKLGTPFQSKAMQMRPGMTVQSVGQRKPWKGSGYDDLPQIIFDEPNTTGAGGNLSRITPGEMYGMQIDNPDAAIKAGVNNREISEAVGLGARTPFKSIVPTEGRPTYLPQHNTPNLLKNYFTGGVNAGEYSEGDTVFNMSARNDGQYTEPNLGELVKAIKGRAKTIVTDAASPDVGPLGGADESVDRLLVNAGYRSKEPGIWSLSDKKDWLRFARNPAKQVIPTGNIKRPAKNPTIDPITGYWKNPDEQRGLIKNQWGSQTKAIEPDYYGSNITDDFVPLWHKKSKNKR